jgi:hypothetical protein
MLIAKPGDALQLNHNQPLHHQIGYIIPGPSTLIKHGIRNLAIDPEAPQTQLPPKSALVNFLKKSSAEDVRNLIRGPNNLLYNAF